MVSIEQVDARVHDVPYMQLEQAKILQDLWETCPEGDILELGFAHGKGSAFLGALASARGGVRSPASTTPPPATGTLQRLML